MNNIELKNYSCENCGTPSKEARVVVSRDDFFVEQSLVMSHREDQSFDYIQNRYSTSLVACGGCQLIYRDRKPTSGSILVGYQEESLDPDYDTRWKASWHPIYSRLLDHVEKRTKGKKGRLIDIGSQLGFFPEIAQERGWNAIGLDPSNYTANEAGEKHLSVVQGASPDLPFPDATFDVITCWTVFENLAHWKDDIRQMRRILKPGGLIALKVANFDFYKKLRKSFLQGSPNNLQNDILQSAHLLGWPYQFGFNPKSMRKILRDAGFTDIDVTNYDLAIYSSRGNIDNSRRVVINSIANAVEKLSGGKKIIGPWLEIYAKKEQEEEDIRIRECDVQNEQQAKGLILEVLGEFGYDYNPVYDADLENLFSFYCNQNGKVIILESDGKVIGIVSIHKKTASTAEIRRLYLKPEFRHRGYGALLLDNALHFCKTEHYQRVVLNTSARFADAVQLYKRRGFRIASAQGENIHMEKDMF